MDSIFEHRGDHDLKVNFNVIKGDFKFEDFLKNFDEVVHNPEYNDSYNILVDIREANFIDFTDNVSVLVDYFHETVSFFNMNCKFSFITTKPLDVVYATLLIEKLRKIGIRITFQIFSSEKAALNWMTV
ncbi:MAG TPA: hypothetical protein P5210_03730 [Draconibacterium sp.]|nr:hypothetical protein [Draconibacterium sp.]HRX10734.1 hypothetical protein [Draconibacterium sp.]